MKYILLFIPSLAFAQVHPMAINADSIWSTDTTSKIIDTKIIIPQYEYNLWQPNYMTGAYELSVKKRPVSVTSEIFWNIDSISGYPKFVRYIDKSINEGKSYERIKSDTIELTTSSLPSDSSIWKIPSEITTDFKIGIKMIDSTQAINAEIDFIWQYDL